MRWKSTHNIFTDFQEVFEENWMNYDTLQTPPRPDWDYSRELKIEDVDIWEVIYEQGGGVGVYASWCPYAEFYLIRTGYWNESSGNAIETYYGAGAAQSVQKRAKELKIPLYENKMWVEPEDMWLYQNPEPKANTLILP
jgi:hypothetical protein